MYGPNYNQYSASAANYYLALAANGVGYGGNEQEQGTVASDTQTEATYSYPNQSNNQVRKDSSRLSTSYSTEENFQLGFNLTSDRDIDLHPDQLSTRYPEPPPELVEELNRRRKKVKIANYDPQPKPIRVANSQQLSPGQSSPANISNFEGQANQNVETEVALLQWEEEQKRQKGNNDWRVSSEYATLDLMDRVDGLVRALFGDFSQSAQLT